MTIQFADAFRELIYPFRKWLATVSYAIVTKRNIGNEQYEIDCVLYDANDKAIKIPENEEIRKITQLWEEDYLSDFIHNWPATHVFDNMVGDEERVYVGFDKLKLD